jgi:SseB protein N-terminal domain
VAGLNTGGPRFAGDDGAADPRIAAILAAYGAGQESEPAVLTALAGSRLLVPLVEAPAEATRVTETAGATGATGACATGAAHDDGCDHRAARELAFPTLIGRDGRPALLAFTSLAALMSWRPEARPVPTPAEQVWGTAVGDSCAVVIDVAGPVPIAVDGARLAALAAGAPPPAPQDDPDLQADVAAALASLPVAAGGPGSSGPGLSGPGLSGPGPSGPGLTGPSVVGAELAAGPDGTDLAVRLLIRPAPRDPQNTNDPQATRAATQQALQEAVQQAVQQAAEAIAGRLASRLRRGIQFSAALAPHPSAATSVTAAPAVSPAPVPSRPHG